MTSVAPTAGVVADDCERAARLLPTDTALCLVDPHGRRTAETRLREPDAARLAALFRGMVRGRRFDLQATALTKQGRLAVYPSARGQEACQLGVVQALREQDWLFPTYRDTMAVVSRGVPLGEAMSLLRGEFHCGYDPLAYRVAPQCTPLATNTLHAVGLGHAAKLRRRDEVAVVLLGDGATSEGDTHEALNFAAVWQDPVVFVIQNNGYAISVPLSKQSAAPSLAHKGIGYGMPSMLVDGNDAAAVYAAVSAAIANAAGGGGPTLIEAVTYRLEAHTNADDAGRYRDDDEVAQWRDRDPIARLETFLRERGELDDEQREDADADAERFAAELRDAMNAELDVSTDELFDHVYAVPSRALEQQRARLRAEQAETAQDSQ